MRVLHDLTAHGECLLTLDEANLLSLKLTVVMREPPTVRERHMSWVLTDPIPPPSRSLNPGLPTSYQHQVGDHEVPVFLRDPEVLKALDWDLALRRVIPHIDGVKYAKRIAMDAEVSCACVAGMSDGRSCVAGMSDGRRGATSKSDSNAAAHL